MDTAEREWVSTADTAKLVRGALKREFPGVKFSVRSKSYSGGASIDVSWTDGPTVPRVDEIVSDYAGGRFDGMEDLKYHAQHWLTPDGIATVQRIYGSSHADETVTPDRPDDARLVHFGADYIFTHREISDEFAGSCSQHDCTPNGRCDGDYCKGCGRYFSAECWVATWTDDDRLRVEFACSQLCAGRIVARHTAS